MDFKIPLRPVRRLGGVLLALALFVGFAVPAQAAPRGEVPFFASAWRLLSALWAETGLEADPGGRSQPAALFGQIGFEVDPGGLTAPAPPPPRNVGFEVDPNG